MFEEALYGFGEEFFSLHSRRFRERSLVHMTESAKRDGREKNTEFRLWSGYQNRFVVNIQLEL